MSAAAVIYEEHTAQSRWVIVKGMDYNAANPVSMMIYDQTKAKYRPTLFLSPDTSNFENFNVW